MRTLIVVGLMVCAGNVKAEIEFWPKSGMSAEWRPYFPVFSKGDGRAFNLFNDATTLENGASHFSAALSIPLLARYVGEAIGGKTVGRKAFWIAGLTWIGVSLLQESCFHAAKTSYKDRAYPSEVRADLLTRVIPTMVLLSTDLDWSFVTRWFDNIGRRDENRD